MKLRIIGIDSTQRRLKKMDEKDLVIYVGQQIRNERKKKKMTQKELGEKVGVKHNTIATYEAGRNAPEQNTIFKIAEALDIRVDDLFPPRSNKTNDFDRALRMAKNLDLKQMEFLNQLIEKTLNLSDEERDKFLESIRFTVNYYEKMNND